jgi:hypothetical protein
MSLHPIPFETLAALWAGELASEDADSIEAHLFSCDECAATAHQLDRLLGTLYELIPPVLSRPHVERLVAKGTRVKELQITQPTGNEAVFTPDLDLIVFALHADMAGADRVDVEMHDAAGTPHLRFYHVPFDVTRGEVLVACQRHYEAYDSLLGAGRFKVFAYTAGQRREVGSFAIKHVWS